MGERASRSPAAAEHTTVAIAGAGPAGLIVAELLRRADIPFILFERHRQEDLRAYPKAGAIEYRTVQLLTAEGIAGESLTFEHENHRCEFRTPDERIEFDYGSLTGGRPHFIYPQHELVGRLCDSLVSEGADLRFGRCVTDVHEAADSVTLRVETEPGTVETVTADVVLGCDGVRGPVSQSLAGAAVAEQIVPVRWVAVIALAPPLVAHTLYGAHPRGFAGQMRRTPTITRYMFEVPRSDELGDWPDDRVRAELAIRLGVDDALNDVPLVDPSLVDLRMRMISPMQSGRIFLAGDAAHLITPAGGKGMNLAIQDAVELAHGLIDCFGARRSDERLRSYSTTRLPAIWRAQAFSHWMLRLILAGSDGAGANGGAPFGRGLREGWISALGRDPLLARWFAHAYAGVDPD
jgi:p-hydroxybenzoate 3-monooxygenase